MSDFDNLNGSYVTQLSYIYKHKNNLNVIVWAFHQLGPFGPSWSYNNNNKRFNQAAIETIQNKVTGRWPLNLHSL